MIGSFMYLTASRPDIMFAVCDCSRFQVTPKTSHLNAMKRIFKYLKGKPNLGVWYPRESSFDLEAYSDSDYAGANLDRKSTTGGCQFLGSRLISWQCKKQTIVATSTTEAEYVAAASCCGQVLWILNQMLDYGFNYMNTKIHIDNESTICIVKNLVYHSKTKHIEIRYHFIRDSYEKKLIRVEKIHTDFNVADLLTKAFDGSRFNFLVVNIAEPTPHPKSPSPEPDSEPIEHTFEQPSPEHQPLSPRQETEVPQSQDPTHPHVAEERSMSMDDLLQLVPKLITKVDSLNRTKAAEVDQEKHLELVKKGRNLQEEGLDEMVRNMMKDKSEVASQEVNTGGLGVSTGSGPVSSARGQREGKAPMKLSQREQTLEGRKTAKQIVQFGMALLAKRMEEEELTEQQKQRKAQVQFEAQHYTEEDWDAIRAKLEAKAE
ncbi:hypothetical protein Tco_0408998 [Tanacetum coccineum]